MKPQREALELVDVAHDISRTHQSAQELHGSAEDFAARKVRELRENDLGAFEPPAETYNARHFIQMSLTMGIALTLCFALLGFLVGEEGLPTSFIGLPFIAGAVTTGVISAMHRVGHRHGFVAGVGAFIGMLAVGIVLFALWMKLFQQINLPGSILVWNIVLAVTAAIGLYLFSKKYPDTSEADKNRQMLQAVEAQRSF
ncbi:hypothetical protein [Rothia sp. ZJ1223]|uniref:hypothetical protein n=1 Tax=Rothia sp. ZJ1223 TaxID=2811098 RepID=UPI00195E31CC|nr:hypothetical protein [Rothia sp. ZJ1223]MBM7051942.1 hypothetical protein [Rothia sp. ZJ1223]